jgi:hypothetical protein
MALVIADRVKETSTSIGTGTIVLSGASSGYQSFAVIGNDNQTYYTIADQGGGLNWEVGIGTYYSANTSLSRTTILASSSAGAAVSFGSNTKDVFVTLPAEKAVLDDLANIVSIANLTSSNVLITGGTINNVSLNNITYGGLGTMSTQDANAVAITGGTINNVSLSNVTYGGLGTMSTQNANAVAITGGNATVTTLNATTGNVVSFVSSNVAITGGTINNVSLSNVTYGGLGTMSTQNANNVAISGGTINGLTNVTTANLIATGGTVNGVIIGGSTAANGSFTNLTLTNQLIANAASGVNGQVLTSGGANVSPYWANTASSGLTGLSNASILNLNVNLTANATINAGVNGFSVGPVNTANGVVITITSGQRWVII